MKYKIILFIVLAVLAILCHTYVVRYENTGPEMLTNNWRINASIGTRGEAQENRLFLFSSAPDKSVNIHQDILPFEAGTILRLSADMRCETVMAGEKSWNRARLLLVQNDEKTDRWDFPHGVATIDGTKDWESYRAEFTVQPETRHLRVLAQLSRCSGTFSLKNIHLYPVIQTQAYGWVQKGILLLWGMFGVFLLGSCFLISKNAAVLRVLLAISLIIIVIGTSMPSEIRNQVSQEINEQLEENSAVMEHVLPENIPKIGHFVFFALFGTLLAFMLQQASFFVVLVHILMVAGATELAQFFIDGRTPLYADFFIDAAGGFLGMAMAGKTNLA